MSATTPQAKPCKTCSNNGLNWSDDFPEKLQLVTPCIECARVWPFPTAVCGNGGPVRVRHAIGRKEDRSIPVEYPGAVRR